MNDLVSILVPAFNCERWIRECLASAVGQTWCHKEVIVVDDGSTDGTLAAARAHASASVKVITQVNQGASAARNLALSLAQGRYIQWLDADDVLAPDKIERQMSAPRLHGDLTLHTCPYGIFHYRIQKARFNASSLWRDHAPVHWVLDSFIASAWMIPAAWLVSRRLAEAAGRWDERLSLNDDGEYFCRVVLASKHVGFVPSAACYYRSTGYSQLSRSKSERAIESLLLSLSLCIEQLIAAEASDRTRRASLALLESYSRFWREMPDVRERADRLAAGLGGRLHGMSADRKAALLALILGPERATRWMDTLRRMRLTAEVGWDGALHRWTH